MQKHQSWGEETGLAQRGEINAVSLNKELNLQFMQVNQ